MFGIFVSCILVYYFYNNSYNLERRIEILEKQLNSISNHMYEPSAPIFILDK